MATEQYANNAQTTLANAIDAGDTTLTVVSAAAFPSVAQFRVRIGNELLLVTAGTGTATWTVTRGLEGTTAATHSAGATVTQVLTAGGLENLLPLTSKGDLLVHDGTDNVRLPVGGNGQVLTADSAETAGVKWAAGGGGAPADAEYLVGAASGGLSAERVVTDTTGTTGIAWDLGTAGQAKANATNAGKWVKLATATASSSATVDFTLPAGYVAYKVVWSHVAPETDNVSMILRTSSNGGGSFDAGASDYEWNAVVFNASGNVVGAADTADSEILISGTNHGNAANENGCGEMAIFNPSAAEFGTITAFSTLSNNAGSLVAILNAGKRLAAADVDAIRFLFSSGNIASGQFDLFGLAA